MNLKLAQELERKIMTVAGATGSNSLVMADFPVIVTATAVVNNHGGFYHRDTKHSSEFFVTRKTNNCAFESLIIEYLPDTDVKYYIKFHKDNYCNNENYDLAIRATPGLSPFVSHLTYHTVAYECSSYKLNELMKFVPLEFAILNELDEALELVQRQDKKAPLLKSISLSTNPEIKPDL